MDMFWSNHLLSVNLLRHTVIHHRKRKRANLIRGVQACETSRLPHYLENRLKNGDEFALRACRPLTAGRFLVPQPTTLQRAPAS
jgi:hypothetical protein